MRSFEGKVAAITGAGSGIGRSIAEALAAQGCALALSDLNAIGLAETTKTTRALGVTVSEHTVDVADRSAVEIWAENVVREHGRVNLLFNNAGVSLSASAAGARYEDLEWIFSINFWGVVHGVKAFLPHLKASGEGHIVNLSSLFGLLAMPGASAYNATKFAVRGYTESLRMELELAGWPVSATSVHPGGIRTNIARTSRSHESVRTLGFDEKQSSARFEKFLVTPPEVAAQVILRAVRSNQRRVLVGRDAWLLDKVVRIFPMLYQRLVLTMTRRSLQ